MRLFFKILFAVVVLVLGVVAQIIAKNRARVREMIAAGFS